ncbi:hypothetical protein [Fictibacillus barbaricus]|uniref:Heme exporter protein D n=1 Tax=Fictibacillus barbaricus TaxID=182136 RepID=A0ABU1TWB7_9BACL|nr:hypothetical protein [Fictibacillus barbaricus]MDR7071506.1 heme exporter protein D [Fictibacillus barbaricus]
MSNPFFSLFPLVGLLFYLAIPIFVVYVALTIIKLMKQKNEYLMEIRDELRKNSFKG